MEVLHWLRYPYATQRIFENIQSRSDITIASEMSDVAIHWQPSVASAVPKPRAA